MIHNIIHLDSLKLIAYVNCVLRIFYAFTLHKRTAIQRFLTALAAKAGTRTCVNQH